MNRLGIKRYIVSSLTITALLGLALGSGYVTAQSDQPSELIIAQPAEILYIDPNVAKASNDTNYHMAVFDALVDRSADGTIVPVLAESWENPSPTEWVFKVRQGVKFHNGEDLNAHSVVNSLNRVTTPMKDFTTVHADYQGLDHWEALDDYTVRIVTKEPDPLFLGRMIRMFVTPPGYIEEVGDEGFEQQPVGSGPFIFIERERDRHIKLRANPDYWRGAPQIDFLTFVIIPEASTAVQALRAGEVHIVQNLPADQFEIVDRAQNTKALSIPSARVPFVWLYPSSPHGGAQLADKRVRQALNHAVNVDEIITFILQGQATRISTIIPPMVFAYDESLQPYTYDPERASQLLTEAGYPDGFDIVFEVPSAGITSKPVEVGEAIASQLSQVGVNATVRPRELGTWFNEKTEGKGAPMMLWSWGGGDYFDPQTYFFGVYHPDSRYALDTDPRITELLDEAGSTTDQATREELLQEVQQIVHEEAWGIFLYAPNDLYGVAENLVWTPRSDERIVVWQAHFED